MSAEVILNDRYVLHSRPFARGGMGEIWLARDRRLDRIVVVKRIHPADGMIDDDLLRRFQREAKLTAQMDHPGVPAVYDLGVHDGLPYLVLQRIHGISVADLGAEHSPLPIGWCALIGAQVATVLAAAHQAGMIHRDIKPRNLLLDHNGAVKVLDFGLAAALGRDDLSRITRTGQSIGTPSYMAPEQVTGEEISPQTDLYGLGCTLYELLGGQPPFTGASSIAIIYQHRDAKPAGLRGQRAEIPVALEEIVLALLEKRPTDRPASATAVATALAEFAVELPQLSGVTVVADSVRSYAALSIRLPSSVPPVVVGRAELQTVLSQAQAQAGPAQLSDAARLLNRTIDVAARTFGNLDQDVVGLRERYAAILYDLGEYRAAAREHRFLAQDLSGDPQVSPDRIVHHRHQAARAHLRLGETSRARQQLTILLQDMEQTHDHDHPVVCGLRAEIDNLDAETKS